MKLSTKNVSKYAIQRLFNALLKTLSILTRNITYTDKNFRVYQQGI